MQIHIALQVHVGEKVDLDVIANHALLAKLLQKELGTYRNVPDVAKVSTM